VFVCCCCYCCFSGGLMDVNGHREPSVLQSFLSKRLLLLLLIPLYETCSTTSFSAVIVFTLSGCRKKKNFRTTHLERLVLAVFPFLFFIEDGVLSPLVCLCTTY
jgi:hypothetical protein